MITSEITLLLPHNPIYLSEYMPPILNRKKKVKMSSGEKEKKDKDHYLNFFCHEQNIIGLKIVFQL